MKSILSPEQHGHAGTQMALWAFALFLLPSALTAAELRLGRAAVSITPPIGVAMGSSYGIRISRGVHDGLHAKVLVLESGGERAALVACDLISFQPFLADEVRAAIEKTTDLTAGRIFLSATHTHAGPQMHPLFLAQVGGEAEVLGNRYRSEPPGKIAEAVRFALQDLQPARVWVAQGRESSISFNRRFRMRDGAVRMNPGALNRDIVEAAGGIDPAVPVVFFDTPGGEPLATYVNFALHVAVAGGDQFSADYPATIAALLARLKGDRMLTMFTMGTAGDINHLDVGNPNQLRGHAESRRIGTVLAGEVVKAYASLKEVSNSTLRVRTTRFEVPSRGYDAGDPQQARQIFSLYGKDQHLPFFDVVWAWRVLDLAAFEGKPLPVDVQVATLGDEVAWVGLPGEIFVDLGLTIKQASPFPVTIVSGMSASGTASYVPTRKAYREGSYEVLSARLAPGGGERLAEKAIESLLELYPRDPVKDRPSGQTQ
jgi:hypothetical protein